MAKDLLQKLGDYRTVDEVAQMLGVNASTVLRWLNSGDLIGFQLGKQWRIAESDIDEFIDTLRRRQAQKVERLRAERWAQDELKRRKRVEPDGDFTIKLCDSCADVPVVVRAAEWEKAGSYCNDCLHSGYTAWPRRLGPQPRSRPPGDLEDLPF